MAISADLKLRVYNDALRILQSRKLSSLTESREPRRVLDDIWGSDDRVVLRALERADWNFATRSVEAGYSTSVTPAFGHTRAFSKPTDLVRLTAISPDPMFGTSLMAHEYADEGGYWLCGFDVLYVKYVSKGDDYGLDGSKWSQAFVDYIAATLAADGADRITNSSGMVQKCLYLQRDALKRAKSRDAMDEGVKLLPSGSWSRSRRGRYSTESPGDGGGLS